MKPRIKICGISNHKDAQYAAQAGADALGFVFYAPSPRAVAIETAAAIIKTLPPFISSVGLFVNAEPAQVQQTLASVPLDLLQFHGEESPEYCQQFQRPYIKAIRMRPNTDLFQLAKTYQSSRGLLLDTYVKGIKGGTGASFQWSLIPKNLPCPIILAGGLDADNISQAVQSVQPWAVDVSGGVEASKGIKDPKKVQCFIDAANA